MGDEKIFKDLTKKYADLAKKIHSIRSKDKRSSSLIKGCSKRIALLDKLRVLEVSYLKCLKNKVKRGQKGGAYGDEEDEEVQKNNRQRALEVCATTLEKGFNAIDKGNDLTENVKIFIKDKAVEIFEKNAGISVEEAKENLQKASQELADRANISMDEAKDKLLEAKDKLLEARNKLKEKANDGFQSMYDKAKELKDKAKNNLSGWWVSSNQQQTQQDTTPPTGGSKKTTYRLNGEKVVLLYKNKKVQRSIYVKGNGKTKYCKINHQYILLSKLKNKIQ
jgi:hypothetical protein